MARKRPRNFAGKAFPMAATVLPIDKPRHTNWTAGMTHDRRGIARETLSALVLLLVVLTGLSRGLVAAADATAFAGGDFVGSICHTHASDTTDPARGSPAAHDCCDECALFAPAALPGAVAVSEPARLASIEARTAASRSLAGSLRTRTPRQAQAPPDALLI